MHPKLESSLAMSLMMFIVYLKFESGADFFPHNISENTQIMTKKTHTHKTCKLYQTNLDIG